VIAAAAVSLPAVVTVDPSPEAPTPRAPVPATTAKPRSALDLETLAKTDPVALLEECRSRYQKNVQGYTVTMTKRERVQGVLYDEEVIRVAVREEPYAVLMLWQSGAREIKYGVLSLGKIEGVLFAAGENKGEMLAWRPAASFLSVIKINPTSGQAQAASRYCIAEGGMGHASIRTHKAWSESQAQGRLKWDYLGEKPVEKAGGRLCHYVRRTCPEPTLDPFLMNDPKPDAKARPADAFRTVTVMLDAETGMQIGSRLERDGELIGEYYFRDLVLNPTFGKEQFKPSSLKK